MKFPLISEHLSYHYFFTLHGLSAIYALYIFNLKRIFLLILMSFATYGCCDPYLYIMIIVQRGIEEEYNQQGQRGQQRAVSPVGSDLWESASLDYPGREEEEFPGEFVSIDEYDVSYIWIDR